MTVADPAAYIRSIVDAVPPLTDEQRDRIRVELALLRLDPFAVAAAIADTTDPAPGEPDVFCPFASDGHCPANPPCPTPRDRACIGDDD